METLSINISLRLTFEPNRNTLYLTIHHNLRIANKCLEKNRTLMNTKI